MTKTSKKIVQSLAFFADNMPDKVLDVMKAYKLLWLADRCHLREHGRTITGDRYYALPKGLVPTDAKHLLDEENTILDTPNGYLSRWIKKIGSHKFTVITKPDLNEFSESDLNVLARVIDEYGNYSATSLSTLSHKYPEWERYESMLSDKNEKNSFPIDIDLMFENSREDDSPLFHQSEEVLEITKEIFHEFNS